VKNSRLVWAALAVAAAGSWAVYAVACDKTKTQASAANATTASYKSAGSSCGTKSATTTTAATAASHEGCGVSASTTTAATASTAGAKSLKTASADGCCSSKSAKSAKATMAAAGSASCGGAMAGVSAACTGQALTMAMCKDSHAGCDACEDMGTFDAELTGASAAVQVVPIKNGVMFVYTAAAPGKVNALQSAVTRRSEHLQKIVTAGDKASLCGGCKSMRGAMASGKVTREVVNIEGGSLALVTSSDPALVRQIRAMADAGKTAARVKS
jgi:hypothetical protein